MTAPRLGPRRLLAPLLLLPGIVSAALALTSTGFRDFAFVASGRYATYSPISPFWLTWSHPTGLTRLALGAGTIGAALTVVTLTRQHPRS